MRIKITGLPKAQNGETIPANITYKRPTDPSDPGMQMPFDATEDAAIKAEQEQIQNKENWLRDPRNQMAGTGFGRDFYESLGITSPTYNASKKYNNKGQEIKSKTNKFKNPFSKIGNSFNDLLTAATPVAQFFDDRKKQKYYDQWARAQQFDTSAVVPTSTSGKHGNYAVTGSSYGKFRYPEMGFTNEGRYFGNTGLKIAQSGGVIDSELSLPSELISLNLESGIPNQTPDYKTNDSNNVDLSIPIPSHWDHYNPGNIHIGDFAKSYNAKAGRNDAGGKVAIFPDMQTGLRAMKDLLFGPGYRNLTVEEARNKWVNGKPNIFNASSSKIAKAVGANKKLSDLTENQKNKLLAEFIKWEDRKVYDKLASEKLIFDDGGSINNSTMRIRITGTPSSKMKYGGQSGYGFDLGQRNTYSDMADNTYEKASNTIGPVPREEANIEAEKGETVYGDLDKDGHREHMTIGGKRHSEGGTPLNVPEGSFIYSDTKKMAIKDPDILKFFSMSPRKSGYTPAEIAKKYNVNKYKAILQDPYADPIKKRTAELMIENSEKKLAYLALVQESMKGFPQGIPEVAESILKNPEQNEMTDETRVKAPLVQPEVPQETEEPQEEMMMGAPEEMMEQPPMMYGGEGYYDYGGAYIPEYDYAYGGGIPYAQMGVQTPPGKKKKYKLKDKEVEANYVKTVPQGYNPYTGIPNLYWRQTPGNPGRPALKHKGRITQAWLNASPEQRKAMSAREQQKFEQANKQAAAVAPTQGSEDYVYIENEPMQKSSLKWTCNPNGEGVISLDPYTPIAPDAIVYNSREEAEVNCMSEDEDGSGGSKQEKKPEEVQKPNYFSNGSIPFFGNQFAVGPKKYHPYASPLVQYIPDPTFLDPSLALANNAAIATTMSRGYTGRPNQYGAMANAAQMNAIGNAANLIGQYDNQNVGIANQFSPLQADILNKTNQYEANRKDTLAFNETMFDKEYRNSLRTYLNNLDKFRKGNYDYYTKRNMLNATNPYYNIVDNPYGGGANIVFRPGVSAFNTIIGPGGASTGATYVQYQKDIDDLKSSGKYTEQQIKQILDRKYGPVGGGRSSSDMQTYNQAYLNNMSSQNSDND